ncbi:MAG: helix-turn-helix domain-containing protein [Corynebacterium sp.]|uniref:helix-turn-helix domain-containing protein n=1 Tax=unclassified Corynebacterium TaxID=2624378 RepID=UPI000962CBEB|nr:XRE family transcriptional regulator [Corynebacterium sp. CNJ-954]OLT51923.1 XRE family transcriptional regulator [Corynebacterium sp. CNJ-954]
MDARKDGSGGSNSGTDEILAAVGPRLRRMRTSRGMTLSAVSGRTGLSVSALSRVETGNRQPTLDILIPLAQVYEATLDQLVAPPQTGDPRVNLRPRSLAGGGTIVPLTGYPGRVQVFKHVLGPRTPHLVSHQGHAWLHVLAGRLRLLLDDDEYILVPGETAQFDPVTPHWFGPANEGTVEILHLFGPQGQRPVDRTLPGSGPSLGS